MTTPVFTQWFLRFAEEVRERPLLLLLDGHLTHTSITVLQKCLDDDKSYLRIQLTNPNPYMCAAFPPQKRVGTRVKSTDI